MGTKTEDTTNSPKSVVTNNANTTELEATIKKNHARSTLNGCERQKLPTMKDRPCKLFVDPKARPFAIHKHRPMVVHWEKETRKGLDRDTDMGVIQPKEVGEPTIWCAPLHYGKPRRVVDLQKLNQACLRQMHPTKAPFLQCMAVPPNSTKTILDAWNGYLLVPLWEETDT